MEMIRTLMRLIHRGPRYFEDGIISIHTNNFRNDKAFKDAKKIASEKSGVYPRADWNLHTVLWAAKKCSELEGDFVECGVDRGFTMRACAEYVDWNVLGKKMYLVDSFTGFPKHLHTEDERRRNPHYRRRGEYRGTVNSVEQTFLGIQRVEIKKGIIPDVLAEVPSKQVAFLSIDLNAAVPEIAAIQYFWPRIVKGGMVVLDDYAQSLNYEVQREAWDAWAEKEGVDILTLATGQGLLVK